MSDESNVCIRFFSDNEKPAGATLPCWIPPFLLLRTAATNTEPMTTFPYRVTAILVSLALQWVGVRAFSPSAAWPASSHTTASTALYAEKATLTDETTWKLRLVLRGMETEKGKKVDEIFRVDAHFLEEEGYEPPQGVVAQLSSEGDRLKITKSRWQLSEDPDDRKDGLWIWGLFKEPLYPFLLLQLETAAIPLAGEDQDVIKPLQLYAQINHRRDDERGVVLEASELKIRRVTTIKADPFGVAKVDVYDEMGVGTLSVLPAISVPS